MKKLLALAACLALAAVAFTGCGFPSCGGETAVSEIMRVKPWANNKNYEKSTYEVKRYAASVNEDGAASVDEDTVLAEGTYTTETITFGTDISASERFTEIADSIPYVAEHIAPAVTDKANGSISHAPGAYSAVRTTLSLTYTDKADAAYAGKTDTMESTVLVRNINMMPVFSHKTAELTTSGIVYESVADYLNSVNVYSQDDGDEVRTEIEENFDNEELLSLVRAQSGVQAGLSTSFEIHNSVETGVYGKEAVNTLAVSVTTGATLSGIDPEDAFVTEYLGEDSVEYFAEDTTDENGNEISAGYSFPANQVTISRTDENRGTSTTVNFSDVDFGYYGNTMTNVMLSMWTYEMDPEEKVIDNFTTYTITDYTINE